MLFVVNLFYDLHLQIGNVALILWGLAFLLFVAEVAIALSIERTEMTRKNFLYILLMYFTYSQMWILLVMYSLFLEIKRVLLGQEVTWYKTERFSEKKVEGN